MSYFPQGAGNVQTTYYSSPNGSGQGGGKILSFTPNFSTSFAKKIPSDITVASNSAQVVSHFLIGNTLFGGGAGVNCSNITANSSGGSGYAGYPLWVVNKNTPTVTMNGGPHAPSFPGDNGISQVPIPAAAVNFTTSFSRYAYTRTVTDGVTSSSHTLTSATANFQSTDQGNVVRGSGIPSNTTISSVNSTTSVTLSNAATTSATGVSVLIAGPAPQADWPLLIWQADTGQVWEFWQACPATTGTVTNWWASYGGTFGGTANPLSKHNGLLSAGDVGGDSSTAVSYLATLITQADIVSGSINHMVAMAVNNDRRITNGNIVSPALRTDLGSGLSVSGCVLNGTTTVTVPSGQQSNFVNYQTVTGTGIPSGTYIASGGGTNTVTLSQAATTSATVTLTLTGLVSEGMIFRFPPGSSCPSGFCYFANLVYNAIRDYGLILIDQAGLNTFECQDGYSWAVQAGYTGSALATMQNQDPITLSITTGTNGTGTGNAYEAFSNAAFWSGLELVTAPSSWPWT